MVIFVLIENSINKPFYKNSNVMWKLIKRLFLALVIIAIAGVGALWFILKGSTTTNRNNYERIADIPTPRGYDRITGSDSAFTAYLRSLPLKPKGSHVMLFPVVRQVCSSWHMPLSICRC